MRPDAMADAVLRRISSATDTDSQPDDRRSANERGRSAGAVRLPGRGVAEGSKCAGPSMDEAYAPVSRPGAASPRRGAATARRGAAPLAVRDISRMHPRGGTCSRTINMIVDSF